MAFIDSLLAAAEPAPVQAQPTPQVQPQAAPVTPQPQTAQPTPPAQKDKPPVTRKSVKAESAPVPQAASSQDAPSFQISEFKGKKWREFLAYAGQRNRNYKTWLNSAVPLAFEGNTLVIGFKLDFLHKKISNETQEIGTILSQVMGSPCHVKCVMSDEYNSSDTEGGKNFSEQLQDIAKEVGGVVRDS